MLIVKKVELPIMEYLNQHFVTEAYLRAWCDPDTPMGAFVWVVSKRDRKIRKKSPRSLFSSPDFYTVYDSSGNRILELEHKLHDIENDFFSHLEDYSCFRFIFSPSSPW